MQGPQAAALLAAWGADVVKVELPGLGDQARWLPVQPGDARSAYFLGCNRGKRSATVDLRVPAGRDVFLKLLETADVVITNFAPGTMDRWGLGYDVVSARNPRIVYATGSTFGTAGPDAAREGNDLSGQAAGGLISTTGVDGGWPTPVGATIADHIASLTLVGGILAALHARERSGRGQHVETSLVGAQVWAQASEITGCLLTGRAAGRANRSNPLIPGLFGIFPTADGWIAIAGVLGADRTRFFELIGRPALATQFPEPLYWDDTKAKLFPLVDDALATKTTAEWGTLLDEARLRWAPVRTHDEVVDDPGVLANGYVADVDDPSGQRRAVVPPVRFSATPAAASSAPPELGQHTEEVLLELGYTWDDIAALGEAGAI